MYSMCHLGREHRLVETLGWDMFNGDSDEMENGGEKPALEQAPRHDILAPFSFSYSFLFLAHHTLPR